MVQLKFTILIKKDIETVWKYFSEFKNISKWDPNTKGCECTKSMSQKIGSQYKVITVFNGTESEVKYKTLKYSKDLKMGYISLFGENDLITALDQIICRQKGKNLTQMEYKADICLKGCAVIFTPFIICSLYKIQEVARIGCRNKARQMWGKAV